MLGRTAEGRSELAERADDSVSSADATTPPFPRGARSMTGRWSVPLCLQRGEAVDVRTGMRASKTPKKHYIDTLASAPTQATQNSASKPNGEQAESRLTNTECWPCWARRHVAKRGKKNTGRLKEKKWKQEHAGEI